MTLAPERSPIDTSVREEATVVRRWVDDRHRLHERVEWEDANGGQHVADKEPTLPYELDDDIMDRLVKDSLDHVVHTRPPRPSRY